MAETSNQRHGDHNGDRLMRGENIDTRSPEDVTHWIVAYTELLTFKDRLLMDMDGHMKSLSAPGSKEILELDVNMVEMQRARYARRLGYWQGRRAQMQRAVGEPG